MIAGFGGELISHAYLEQQLLRHLDREQVPTFERSLVRWWRVARRTLGPASSARAVHDTAVLPLLQLLDHPRPVSQPDTCGMLSAIGGSDAVVLSIPWAMQVRSAWRDAVRRGAAAQASWALVCNGRSLRIFDCDRAWTRAALEFDFEALILSPAGVAALWLLASRAALAGRGGESLHARVRASDAHASGICRSLSDGVLDALPRLAAALKARRESDAAVFDQALTVVYRILFLLFAEARSLVPSWHQLYRDAYTIDALTRRAANSNTSGLWDALQAISRLAHAGCTAGDLSVTAFNGRLFSPRHTPLAERRHVPDEILRDILLALATTMTKQGRVPISYHDLGVEQLGSVYERVLEYEPRQAGTLSRTSSRRKSTGSFYTPRSLTEFVVRRTLAPLVAGKACDEILKLRILDPAMGSGAFLVAACHYLAECCEHALVRDGAWHDGDAPAMRSTLRRQVAERCLYGVDLNPTAVQLARVSLWLTTLAGDRPLTFLDHHLAAGNSLIGAWLADLPVAPRPPRPRAPLPLFDDQVAEDVREGVLPARLRLAFEPSDTLEAVRSKERMVADLARPDGPLEKWRLACDAWCAGALWRNAPPPAALVSEWIASVTGAPTSLPAARLRASLDDALAAVAGHAPLHWELQFPEVFFDADGRRADAPGFDAVIGNPPWDVLRADLGSAVERAQARAATSAALRFFRMSRAYHLQGTGHPNRYQLFVERAVRLARRGGRIGLLLPSGIATDHGSAALRRHLLDHTTIDTWLGFDNTRRIFPIHRSVRFVVLATTNDGGTAVLRFRCGLADADALHRDDVCAGALSISRARLESLNPDLNVPGLDHAGALAILTGIADRVPALGDRAGWHVRFGRELNATDDRPHLVAMKSRAGLLPIVQGKQLAPFRADLDRSTLGIPIQTAATLIDRAGSFDRDRIAYRDVASATNKLTLIAAMLPAGALSTHTVFVLKTVLDEESQWALLGLLNSLVANYLVRVNVTTHVTTAIMSRLRVPKPSPRIGADLARLSRRLAVAGITEPSDDYAALNAIAARLYGVSRDEFAAILESFPLIAKAQRERCLAAYSTRERPLST
jgi:hypothetical protein